MASRLQQAIALDDNPFFYLKTRYFFLWYFLITCGVLIQLVLIDLLTPLKFFVDRQNLDFIEPLYEVILILQIFTLCLILIKRQCNLYNINLQQIIGKIPNNFSWLPIIFLVSFRFVFSLGIYRVSNYPLLFIAPQWLESRLNNYVTDNIFTHSLESSFPVVYFIVILLMNYVLWEILNIFIIHGIVLHRLASKWGNRKAVWAISLFYGLMFYTNFISGFILGLLLGLLYIKTRTLIVPIVFRVLSNVIYLIVDAYYFFIAKNSINNVLSQFQSEFKLGILLTAISTPYLVYWLYKNWMTKNEQLPYFANAQIK